MIEVLPIRLLTEEDAPIFGSLSMALGKLFRAGLPVSQGLVVTAPNLKLKTTLEHHDFGTKEVLEQSLTLVKKEINSIPAPAILSQELGKQKHFFLKGEKIKSAKNLWLALLSFWLEEIKNRLWNNGFYVGITEDLDPQVVTFFKKIDSFGSAYFDPLQDDVVINTKFGNLHPRDLKKIVDLVKLANKNLLIPYQYEWILDKEIKLVKVLPYTPIIPDSSTIIPIPAVVTTSNDRKQSAVKVFFDLSTGFTIEKNIDGVYIASEKIFDLNKPRESFDNLAFKIVESALTFPNSPVLVKLADKSEGMGKVRGTYRLLHQQSLLTPLVEVLDFARHKKGLTNVHIVIPFVRTAQEFIQLKRELAVKKLMRKNSLKLFLELAVPENIINLENYFLAGLDGVVLNLDELIGYLNGFDGLQEDLLFYKNEVDGLIIFLANAIKLLHKAKIPFISYGTLALYPKVLDFLVEKGVYGIVVERYEAHSAHELLYQTEKRMVLRKS